MAYRPIVNNFFSPDLKFMSHRQVRRPGQNDERARDIVQ